MDFDAALDGAALVIIGEGSLDTQTLAGKAPVGVARAAARRGIPVVAVAGRSTLTEGQLATTGISRGLHADRPGTGPGAIQRAGQHACSGELARRWPATSRR